MQDSAKRYYEAYVKNGLVLSPMRENRVSLDKTFPRYSGRTYTSYVDLATWFEMDYEVGLSLGKFSKYIAVEILSMRGHLVFSAWSNQRVPVTWEYVLPTNAVIYSRGNKTARSIREYKQLSHFYIFKLPDDFIPWPQVTFYSENDWETIDKGRSGGDRNPIGRISEEDSPIGVNRTPTKNSDLIVWGEGYRVPIPDPLGDTKMRDFSQIRPPSLLFSRGGIPIAPKWLLYAIEANTVKKYPPYLLPSEVALFVSRNLVKTVTGRVSLTKTYELYIYETYETGAEPLPLNRFVEHLKRLGFKTRVTTIKGLKRNFITNAQPLRFSRLDFRVRNG